MNFPQVEDKGGQGRKEIQGTGKEDWEVRRLEERHRGDGKQNGRLMVICWKSNKTHSRQKEEIHCSEIFQGFPFYPKRWQNYE